MLYILYLIKNIIENTACVAPFILDEIFVENRAPFYLIISLSEIGLLLHFLTEHLF
jgi:hypothetical protein